MHGGPVSRSRWKATRPEMEGSGASASDGYDGTRRIHASMRIAVTVAAMTIARPIATRFFRSSTVGLPIRLGTAAAAPQQGRSDEQDDANGEDRSQQ